jgi:hypothetical protein
MIILVENTNPSTGAHVRSNRSIILALTLTWVITIPLELLFWVAVVGWSLELALLISVPILVIWIPLSYLLAIAANDNPKTASGIDRPNRVHEASGLLGILSGSLSACAVWLNTLMHSGYHFGAVFVMLLMCGVIWAVLRTSRSLLKRVSNRFYN